MTSSVLVLLVEDEPLVLAVLEAALEDAGYSVILATNGQEAIAALDNHVDPIAGLLTDVRLGEGPDGWNVARYARHKKPELPVVYTTGDSAADWPAEGVPKSILIQKPYAPAQAVTAISMVLNQASSTPHGVS